MVHKTNSLYGFERVVLVADIRTSEANNSIEERHDLEMSAPNVVENIRSAINEIGLEVVHYEAPLELSENARLHSQDIILSIFGGQKSRNRMCLVPAVCETHGLNYLGPDAYGRIMCQDKEVSKLLAREAGFLTPAYRLIRSQQDLINLEALPLPYVIKPLLEGTSIGIGSQNLVSNHEMAKSITSKLIQEFDQPVIAEVFVPGREVSLNFIETEKGIITSFVELVMLDDPNYFSHNLYDVTTKGTGRDKRKNILIDMDEPKSLRRASKNLVASLGTVGFGRIDGKLFNNEFHFLEITPDAYLAPWGTIAAGYMAQGHTYAEFMKLILNSNRPKLPYQSAND